MKMNLLSSLFVSAVLVTMIATDSLAQSGAQTRSITSDDFASKREKNEKSTAKRQQFSYKYVRGDKNVIRRKTTQKTPTPTKPSKAAEKFTEIGVTIWKLRPPLEGEAGYMIPVLDENKKSNLWLAERVDAEMHFKDADKVRFAVESSVPGYLYVFDRETNTDGSFGEPFLIFPESLDDNNAVGPGLIADIPDQRDDFPYFNMNPKKGNYSGELLTVIISPKRLENFVIDDEGRLRNPDDLIDLEFGAEAEIFSRTDTTDKIYTTTESKSACGVKTRQLERVKTTGKPCGNNSTRLTPDEPLPQTIYRVKAVSGKPAVAFVRLLVR